MFFVERFRKVGQRQVSLHAQNFKVVERLVFRHGVRHCKRRRYRGHDVRPQMQLANLRRSRLADARYARNPKRPYVVKIFEKFPKESLYAVRARKRYPVVRAHFAHDVLDILVLRLVHGSYQRKLQDFHAVCPERLRERLVVFARKQNALLLCPVHFRK